MSGRPGKAAAAAVYFLPPGAEVPGDGQLRDELEKVFERPEFRAHATDLWAQLGEMVRRFFRWLETLSSDQPAVYWLVLLGSVALLLLLVGHLTWTVVRAFSYRGVPGEARHGPERRRQLSARCRAEERAGAGDYTEAVRLLFLALLHAYDESGRLLFQPALTNREYLRFFADRPAVEGRLRVLVDVLDANWYGSHPTDAGRYAECRALYDSLNPL